MIGRIEALLRQLRRGLSRSEWLVKLLRLPRSEAPPTAPGLVMIQIDGLSHTQLKRALERGEMPFLRRLVRREHYRLHHQYAGVPATTAAFQGELFYGVRAAVPGFNFRDSVSGRFVRMVEPAAAAGVERALAERGGEPLLKDGSSYVNFYTGGAAESHFCPSALGWGPALRTANPLVVALLILSNLYSFLRTAALLIIELGLALADFVRGLIAGYDFLKELKFIPTRAAVAVLLRELATIGAKIDIARGLPIIHLNFLGYDEQAHRRGPTSLFAHWTLKGIDNAIARLWRAAHRSAHRHYDVWIYSDHGQEEVEPYYKQYGRTIEEAVSAVFAELGISAAPVPAVGTQGVQTQRVRQLGGKRIQRLFPINTAPLGEPVAGQVAVAGLGPVSFVYCEHDLTPQVRNAVARALVATASIPLVLTRDGPGRATAWTDAGIFTLPRQDAEVLGAAHPFLEQAAEELIALCHHSDAGDFVLCGWRAGATACSFTIENGAHGGAGPEETRAFALLPGDAPLSAARSDALRAGDLRQAALHLLGRAETKRTVVAPRRHIAQGALRIMTYNAHSCIGMDGKLSPERIARVIARYRPDVVALQELDVGRARTEGVDQAHLIAGYLEMDFHFHPAIHIEEERYGDAILTHLSMRLVKAGPLPGLPGKPYLEPRGALWVAVELDGTELQVLNTHLGLLPRERRVQVEALLGPDWLGHPDCRRPVLCGDFNALPASKVCRRLRQRLNDAQIELDSHRPKGTFFGRLPTARIDHVYVDPALDVVDVEVPDSDLARVASDHLPLIVELQLPDVKVVRPQRSAHSQ